MLVGLALYASKIIFSPFFSIIWERLLLAIHYGGLCKSIRPMHLCVSNLILTEESRNFRVLISLSLQFQTELPVLPFQEVPWVWDADSLGPARRGEDEEEEQHKWEQEEEEERHFTADTSSSSCPSAQERTNHRHHQWGMEHNWTGKKKANITIKTGSIESIPTCSVMVGRFGQSWSGEINPSPKKVFEKIKFKGNTQ